jgi:energy-coupling factor transporter ATP-binding protein EcfA2
MHYQLAMMDVEDFDDEQRQTQERRMATYSFGAMQVAIAVDRIFVAHNDFGSTLNALDRAYQLGRDLSVPQGVSLIGPTGSGKTSLLKYFEASLPPSTLFEAGLGVISVRLPERPSVGRVVSMLLAKLRYPFPKVSDQTVGAKRGILIEALRAEGTRLVGFDEAGHMCGSGVRKAHASKTGNEITELACELIDEARVAVALCGNEQLAALDQVDPALGARIAVRQRLHDFADSNEWAGFLAAFSRDCKVFDITFICQPGQATLTHKATKGNARRTKTIIIEAVLVAFDLGLSNLNREVMVKAYARVNGKATLDMNPWLTSRAPAVTSNAVK